MTFEERKASTRMSGATNTDDVGKLGISAFGTISVNLYTEDMDSCL